MNGEGQSQQPDKPPTAPEPASAEQAQKAPTTPEPLEQPQQTPATSDARKKADSQTSGSESRSKSRKVIKAVFSPIGALIAALLGFLLGIGSNQVTDYVKRADDCADALAQFKIGLDSNYTILSNRFHNFDLTFDQREAIVQQFDNLIAFPFTKVTDKCPVLVRGSSEYLNSDLVNRWNASSREFLNCFLARECSRDDARHHALATSDLTTKLEHEAIKVSQWGLVRRAKYEVTHLY